MKQAVLLSLFLALALGDLLQNPDFEIPPLKLPANSTGVPFVLLNENNTIPGWTFEGEVQYVTAGPNVSLPMNGHAVQLGQDVEALPSDPDTRLGGLNCSANASLVVSAPDSDSDFSFKNNYGKEAWASYGHYLGNWGDGESIYLVLHSENADFDPNSTCWPMVDSLILKPIGALAQGQDNLLLNGGFETGPDFLNGSSEGILLDPEPSILESALQRWLAVGTVKYIDSKHYYVPEGKAAIEIVSGASTGIQTAQKLSEGSSYALKFDTGDANDLCVGDFLVEVRAGSTVQNVTLHSNGTGSAKTFSLNFKGGKGLTVISFLSYKTTQRKDGVLCGPVLDDVVLRASEGKKLRALGVSLLLVVHWLFMSFN
ncbi:hypothetical protein NMG60_11006826 [Bertholletia excelsa]